MKYEDKGVHTEVHMTDEAMNTDVTVKDKGVVSTHQDHYYCQRYVQEETKMEDNSVNTEFTEQTCVQLET